jgi:hypothetical protein
VRRAAAAILAALATSACTAVVELGYTPARAQVIDAAGIHRVLFCVSVRDVREVGDPRDVGQTAGWGSALRSTRDAADVVRDALVAELRSHDLRVAAPAERCDASVEVELTDLYALAYDRGGPLPRGEVEGHVGGDVRVLDRHSDRLRLDLPVEGHSEVHSMLLTRRKYEWALNAALAEFAQRTVRHPDFLIAVQTISRPAR